MDFQSYTKVKTSSEKNFGIVFAIFFLIIATWPILNSQPIRIWALVVAGIFFVSALFIRNVLRPLNKLWFKFGMLLGKITSPIILFFIFFFVVTPTAIIMRLLGKDLLDLKIDKFVSSYWIIRKNRNVSMRDQF